MRRESDEALKSPLPENQGETGCEDSHRLIFPHFDEVSYLRAKDVMKGSQRQDREADRCEIAQRQFGLPEFIGHSSCKLPVH